MGTSLVQIVLVFKALMSVPVWLLK
ncbi:hypothetical protein [Helicobacter bizzozeronii]|nr:hypothetical protein [Helicobacter bizzozeronii]